MAERTTPEAIERKFVLVDEWVDYLTEIGLAKELDRASLRTVLEECGADFEIADEARESLHSNHYSANVCRKGVAAIWGDQYDEFVSWTKEYVKTFEAQKGKNMPELEKRGRKIGKKFIGLVGLIEELTAYAAGDDESYPFGTFFVRMSQRALNGKVRYELGLTKREFHFHLIVPGYNTIKYEFIGQEGDVREGELPFAPASFPPEFPKLAWEHIKSWR